MCFCSLLNCKCTQGFNCTNLLLSFYIKGVNITVKSVYQNITFDIYGCVTVAEFMANVLYFNMTWCCTTMPCKS